MGILDIIFGIGKNEITQKNAVDLIKNHKAQLIDVRNYAEYRPEHLTPCFNIDVSSNDFIDQLKNYKKDNSYIVYCKSGVRSKKAFRQMQKAGFTNVKSLKGGIEQWSGSKRVK
jgi:phage shock protein E